jgi:hypothetical protein
MTKETESNTKQKQMESKQTSHRWHRSIAPHISPVLFFDGAG